MAKLLGLPFCFAAQRNWRRSLNCDILALGFSDCRLLVLGLFPAFGQVISDLSATSSNST